MEGIGLGTGRRRSRGSAGGGPATYLGYAATRGAMNDMGGDGLTSIGGKRMMRVRGSCTGFRFKFMNWYWNRASGHVEADSGAVTALEASIEYPAGTFTRFLFSGANIGAAAAGADVISDPLNIAIPADATIQLHWNVTGTNLGYFKDYPGFSTDRFEYSFGGTVANRVMTGGEINSGSSATAGGVALLAMTALPSALLLTDSKGFAGDLYDTSGDKGEVARSIGPAYGYLALASYGDDLAGLAASGGKRRRQAAHASFVLSNMSVNSIGASATTTQTQLQSLWASGEFAGKKLFHTTLSPETTGTFSSDAGQTPKANFGSGGTCDQVNTWLRGVPAPLTAVFDTRAALQSTTNPNVFYSDGTAYTGDGVHPNQAGYLRVLSQGVITPGSITV